MKIVAGFLIFIISSMALGETISLTCSRVIAGKRYSNNVTIISPSGTAKGKVYSDDRDLDRVSSDSLQKVNNVVINSSTISYEVNSYFEPTIVGGRQYGAGTVSIINTISRTSGDSYQTTTTNGGILGETFGNKTEVTEGKCEPRRANKF